jgi:hypothetical protein
MERGKRGKVSWGKRKILSALVWCEARESVEGLDFVCSQNRQSFVWPGRPW